MDGKKRRKKVQDINDRTENRDMLNISETLIMYSCIRSSSPCVVEMKKYSKKMYVYEVGGWGGGRRGIVK